MPQRKQTPATSPQSVQPELFQFAPIPGYDDPSELADLSPAQEVERVHYMDTEGISAEEARRKALGAPVVRNAMMEIDSSVLPEIGRVERFVTVKANHGFYPLSLRQISEVTTLDAYESVPGGAAKHIAEIAQHQEKHKSNPTKATMSVVSEYAGYASSARSDVTALTQLKSELEGADAHPFTTVDKYAVTARGLLVRHLDIESLATDNLSPFAPNPIAGYSENVKVDPKEYASQQPGLVLQEYIDKKLSGVRLDEAYKATQRAVQDRSAAKEYWIAQLRVIHKHTTGPARVVAGGALGKLGVKL